MYTKYLKSKLNNHIQDSDYYALLILIDFNWFLFHTCNSYNLQSQYTV